MAFSEIKECTKLLALILLLACVGWTGLNPAAAQETYPGWFDLGEPSGKSFERIESGSNLIGRSFLLDPELHRNYSFAPPYDTRLLLQFAEGSLVAYGASGTNSYNVTYEQAFGGKVFGFDAAEKEGLLNAQARLLRGEAKYHLVIGKINDRGTLCLFRESSGRDNISKSFDAKLGYLRELNAAEGDEFKKYLGEVESKRAELLRESPNAPLDWVDVTDVRGGRLLSQIYHGEFDKISDRPGDDGEKHPVEALADRQAWQHVMKAWFVNYHNAYGALHERADGEGWSQMTRKWVTEDRFGREIDSELIDEVPIRSRYANSYAAAQPNALDLGLSLLRQAAENRMPEGAERRYALIGQYYRLLRTDPRFAVVRLLDVHGSDSPNTLRQFENNLDRLMSGRPPIKLPRKDVKIAQANLKLPWEDEGSTGKWALVESDEIQAKWMAPSDWHLTTNSRGSVTYHIGEPLHSEVKFHSLFSRATFDSLAWVNRARKDSVEPYPPVENVTDDPGFKETDLGGGVVLYEWRMNRKRYAYDHYEARLVTDGRMIRVYGSVDARFWPELERFIKTLDFLPMSAEELDRRIELSTPKVRSQTEENPGRRRRGNREPSSENTDNRRGRR